MEYYRTSDLESIKLKDNDLFEKESDVTNNISSYKSKRFLRKINCLEYKDGTDLTFLNGSLNTFSSTGYYKWNIEMDLYNLNLVNYTTEQIFSWNTEMNQYNTSLNVL